MKIYSFSGAKEYQNKSVFNALALQRSYRLWWFCVALVLAVQFLSHVWLFVTPWTAACQVPLSSTSSWSQVFESDNQNIGASTSATVLPMNIQGWLPLGLTGLNLQLEWHSRIFSTTIGKYQFFSTWSSLWSTSHIHTWLQEKPELWLYRPLSTKWCFCFLICYLCCPRFPSNEHVSFNFHGCSHSLKVFWSPRKSVIASIFLPLYLPWSDGTESQVTLVVKNLPANVGDVGNAGLIPGLGRFPTEGMIKTHSNILAWRISWIEETPRYSQ